MRKMDEDYAKLSFAVGVFASAADSHLGGKYFETKTRAEAWDLTWEKLAAWKAEAWLMGVPTETISQIEEMPEGMMENGMALQAEADAKHEASLCGCIRCYGERWEKKRDPWSTPGFRYACEICGHKRCPHHTDHRLVCTNSNATGQPGSAFT